MSTARRLGAITRDVIHNNIKTVKHRQFGTASASTKNNPIFVFGLGNPGDKYAKTRHNVGFLCLDNIAKHYNIDLRKEKFESIYGGAFKSILKFA
jgi:hypothetical protein